MLMLFGSISTSEAGFTAYPAATSVPRTTDVAYIAVSRSSSVVMEKVKFATRKISAFPAFIGMNATLGESKAFSFLAQKNISTNSPSSIIFDYGRGAATFTDVDKTVYLVIVYDLHIDVFYYNGALFKPFQQISGRTTARKPTVFSINGETFLVVPEHPNNSTVFKWINRQFVSHQRLLTVSAKCATYFNNSHGHFVAIAASIAVDQSSLTLSPIYKFNPTTSLFEIYQNIPTLGALTISHFESKGRSVLLVANQYISVTASYAVSQNHIHVQNSLTGMFETTSSNDITTYGAMTWAVLKIGSDIYCGVANQQVTGLDYVVPTGSVIYKWNSSTLKLEAFQSLLGVALNDLTAFEVQGISCFALGSRGMPSDSFVAATTIYGYNAAANNNKGAFQELDTFKTTKHSTTISMIIEGKQMLVVLSWKPAAENILMQVGFAAPDTDYVDTNGTITFQAGESSILMPFGILNSNRMVSGNRSFALDVFDSTSNNILLTSVVSIFNIDTPSIFLTSSWYASVNEQLQVGTVVTPSVPWNSALLSGQVEFSILSSSTAFFFVNSSTGVITTLSVLNWLTTASSFMLTMKARILGSTTSFDTANIFIDINDINNNYPTFVDGKNTFDVSFTDSVPMNTELLKVIATDLDRGLNGTVSYSFDVGTLDFSIDSKTGAITTKRKFDSTVDVGSYSLTVRASDGGQPSKSMNATVTIILKYDHQFAPIFSQSVTSLSIPETTAVGSKLTTLLASDQDPSYLPQGTIIYSLVVPSTIFAISSSTGSVLLLSRLDYTVQNNYSLQVRVCDGGALNYSPPALPLCDVSSLMVTLTYVSQIPPNFSSASYAVDFLNRILPDTTIISLISTSVDPFYSVRYSLQAGDPNSDFFVIKNASIGLVSAKILINAHANPTITFQMVTFFANRPENRSVTKITVRQTLDGTQSSVQFSRSSFSFNISQLLPSQSSVGTVSANGRDNDGTAFLVYYNIVVSALNNKFSINSVTGEITTLVPLFYSESSQYLLTIHAFDAVKTSIFATTVVVVDVVDTNIYSPTLSVTSIDTTVLQSAPVGYEITSLVLFDADVTELNRASTLTIISGAEGVVTLNLSTGVIKLARMITAFKSLAVIVEAKNLASPFYSSTVIFRVHFTPENMYSPVFDTQTINNTAQLSLKLDDLSVGSQILTFSAYDQDLHQPYADVSFYIESSNSEILQSFQLTTIKATVANLQDGLFHHSGKLVVSAGFNFLSLQTYQFSIGVKDNNNATTVVRTGISKQVIITVFSATKPVFLPFQVLSVKLTATNKSGVFISMVRASTTNQYDTIIYRVTGGGESFSVDSSGMVMATNLLSVYIASYFLTITATSKINGLSSNIGLNVTVIHPPRFSMPMYQFSIENSYLKSIGFVKATTINVAPDAGIMYYLSEVGCAPNSIDTFNAPSRTSPNSSFFQFEAITGEIIVKYVYNMELICDLQVTAIITSTMTSGQSSDRIFSIVNVAVNITRGDLNQYYPPPQFNEPDPSFIVVPHGASGVIGTFEATWEKPTGVWDYRISGGDVMFFSLQTISQTQTISNSHKVNLKVGAFAGRLNFRVAPYVAILNVYDRYNQSEFSEITVYVFCSNNPTIQPAFNLVSVNTIPARAQVGYQFGSVHAVSINKFYDSAEQPLDVRYRIISGDNTGSIALDSVSGALTVNIPLDFKVRSSYTLVIMASFNNDLFATTEITFAVLDANDNIPVITNTAFFFEIFESDASGTSVFIVESSDLDTGTFGVSSCAIIGGNDNNFFSIEPHTCSVSIRRNLSAAVPYGQHFLDVQLEVVASNVNTPFWRSQMVIFQVRIYSVDDASPVFYGAPYATTVFENIEIGSAVFTIAMTNADGASNHVQYINSRLVDPSPVLDPVYSMSGSSCLEVFSIGSKTGIISLIRALDVSYDQSYICSVTGTNNAGQEEILTTVTIGIISLNINLHSPEFDCYNVNNGIVTIVCPFGISCAACSIGESVKYSFTVAEKIGLASAIGVVSAFDRDNYDGGVVRYQIKNQLLVPFSIDEISGIIYATEYFNFSAVSFFQFSILAYDLTSLENSGVVTLPAESIVEVRVLDSSHAPVYTMSTYALFVSEASFYPDHIISVYAVDYDLPALEVTYEVVAWGTHSTNFFAFDSYNGSLTLTADLFDFDGDLATVSVAAFSTLYPSKKSIATIEVHIIRVAKPFFDSLVLFSLSSHAPGGYTVGRVHASTPHNDVGMMYEIVNSEQNLFHVHFLTGVITLTGALNFKQNRVHVISMKASYQTQFSLFESLVNITVQVLDENDFTPMINNSQTSFAILKNISVNEIIFTVVSTDIDSGVYGISTYQIVSGNGMNFFSINLHTGQVSIASQLVVPYGFREVDMQLNIVAVNVNTPFGRSAEKTFTITIHSVDNDLPEFHLSPYVVTIPENAVAGFIVFQAVLTNADGVPDHSISDKFMDSVPRLTPSYSLVDHKDVFDIDSETGVISLIGALDISLVQQYNCTLKAVNLDFLQETIFTMITINIISLGLNMHGPQFQSLFYNFVVPEKIAVGDEVGIVFATDVDPHEGGVVVYELVSPSVENPFNIIANSGAIIATGILDVTIKSVYIFYVAAYDLTTKRHNGFITPPSIIPIQVEVSDDSRAPVFLYGIPTNVSLSEFAAYPATVITVAAKDEDDATNEISYSMEKNISYSSWFDVSVEGKLLLIGDLFIFPSDLVILPVTAFVTNYPRKNTTIYLKVQVIREPTPMFDSVIVDDISESAAVDTLVGRVHAVTPHHNAGIIYSIMEGDGFDFFTISASEGIISVKAKLTYSIKASFNITILATYGDALLSEIFSSAINIIVNVIDENDHAPLITTIQTAYEIMETIAVGSIIFTVSSSDIDHGFNGASTYDLKNITMSPGTLNNGNLNGFLAINSLSGAVSIRSSLNNQLLGHGDATQVLTLYITATNVASPFYSDLRIFFIVVRSVDNNPPIFEFSNYLGTIDENATVGTIVAIPIQIRLSNADGVLDHVASGVIDDNPGLNPRYSLIGSDVCISTFSIDTITGDVMLIGSLDVSLINNYECKIVGVNVQIQSSGSGSEDEVLETDSTFLSITVNNLQLNSHSPMFNSESYLFTMSERVQPGTIIGYISAVDGDTQLTEIHSARNVVYVISPQLPAIPFEVDLTTGNIILTSYLNFASQSNFILQIYAFDVSSYQEIFSGISSPEGITPPTVVNISLTVLDDSIAPTFSFEATRNISEYNSNLYQVRASDLNVIALPQFLRYQIDQTVEVHVLQYIMLSSTGELSLIRELSSYIGDLITIPVIAYFEIYPLKTSLQMIRFNIIRQNKHSPIFNSAFYTTTIVGQVQKGYNVIQVSATDLDTQQNYGEILFSLSTEVATVQISDFRIDSLSGQIFTLIAMGGLDRPVVTVLTVIASDKGNPPRKTEVPVYILFSILDFTEFTPSFAGGNAPLIVSIDEQTSVNSIIATVQASLTSSNDRNVVIYSILETDNSEAFKIDVESGQISTNVIFDRNDRSFFTIQIQASNYYHPAHLSIKIVQVVLLDTNVNKPTFQAYSLAFNILEDSVIGYVVFTAFALDMDPGKNGMVSYYILDSEGAFSIDGLTGAVKVAKRLRSDATFGTYNVSVFAIDAAVSSKTSDPLLITITVKNAQPSPVFDSTTYVVNISEHAAVGVEFLTVHAADFFGDNIVLYYSINSCVPMPCAMQIDNTTGTLSVFSVLNRLVNAWYEITVIARDDENNVGSSGVFVILNNMNHAPVFSTSIVYSNIVADTSNVMIGLFIASDDDVENNAILTYTIVPSMYSTYFEINPVNANLKLTTSISYYDVQQFNITIRATDAGNEPMNGDLIISLRVLDKQDNRPVFGQQFYNANVSENNAPVTSVITISALDISSHNNLVRPVVILFSLEGTESFTIHPVSGQIETSRSLSRLQATVHNFIVIAVDATGMIASAGVQIYVLDENDHAPVFLTPSTDLIVVEGASYNSLGYFSAMDSDNGVNGTEGISYALLNSEWSELFSLNMTTAQLSLVVPLDAEIVLFFTLIIRATDGAPKNAKKFTDLSINIMVTDVNEYPPLFVNPMNYVEVDMGPTALNDPVMSFIYTDADATLTNTLSQYTIESGNGGNWFNIVGSMLVVSTKLDYVVASVITLVIRVYNVNALINKFTDIIVVVNVTDKFRLAPQFVNPIYSSIIAEDIFGSVVVATVNAFDSDIRGGSKLSASMFTYAIVSGGMFLNQSAFQVNPSTGQIYTILSLDRESQDSFTLFVEATLHGYYPRVAICQVDIQVEDVNDNNPLFANNVTITLNELLTKGTFIIDFTANDLDVGNNGYLSYSCPQSNMKPLISIDSTTGIISIENTMFYAVAESITLIIFATDNGMPSRAGFYILTILLLDVNDQAPVFTSVDNFQIFENATVNTLVGTMLTTDSDYYYENSFVEYSISNGNNNNQFFVNATSGQIFLRTSLDRTITRDHYLIITASNSLANQVLTSSKTVKIEVTNANNHIPEFYTESMLSLTVWQNTTVGTPVFIFGATSLNEGVSATLHYSLESKGGSFSIDYMSGVLSVSGVLNVRVQEYFTVIVTVTTSGTDQRSSSMPVNITILNVNTVPPAFTALFDSVTVQESAALGALVYKAQAFGDVWFPTMTYAIVSGARNMFIINAQTGQITVANLLNWSSIPYFRILISAENNANGMQPGHTTLLTSMTVEITVIDENNHNPIFAALSYNAIVNGGLTSVTPVIQISATDIDNGKSGTAGIYYVIITTPKSDKFQIDPATGWIFAVAPLDYYCCVGSKITLAIRAYDSGSPQKRSNPITVTVNIANVYDDAPVFQSNSFSASSQANLFAVSISETASIGTTLIDLNAIDHHMGYWGPIQYFLRISDPLESGLRCFQIDKTKGEITVASNIFEQQLHRIISLYVEAVNNGGRSVAVVSISITDGFTHTPFFVPAFYSPVVAENALQGSKVFEVSAIDQNLGDNGPIYFSITYASEDNYDGSALFSIDVNSGSVFLTGELNYENSKWILLQITSSFDSLAEAGDAIITDEPTLPTSEAGGGFGRRAESCDSCSGFGSAIACKSSEGITCSWEPDQLICRVLKCSDFTDRSSCTANSCVFDDDEGFCYDNGAELSCEHFDAISCPPTRCANDLSNGKCTALNGFVDCHFYNDNNCPLNNCIVPSNNGGQFDCIPRTVCSSSTRQTCPYGCFFNDLISQCIDVPDNSDCYPAVVARRISTTSTSTTTIMTTTTTTTTSSTTTTTTTKTTTTTATTTILTRATSPVSTSLVPSSATIAPFIMSTSQPHTSPSPIVGVPQPKCSRCTWVYVNITITNDNSHVPIIVCPTSTVDIQENALIGSAIFQCSAINKNVDSSAITEFSLEPFMPGFSINATTGIVSLRLILDAKLQQRYTFNVVGKNLGYPTRLVSSVTVMAAVLDVNNHAPQFHQHVYKFSMVENSIPSFFVGEVSATDGDINANAELQYEIINGVDTPFDISTNTGKIFLAYSIDGLFITSYSFVVRVADLGFPSLFNTVQVDIDILFLNEYAPVFYPASYSSYILENLQEIVIVANIRSTDLDFGNNGTSGIRYKFPAGTDARFVINEVTGNILLLGPLTYNAESSLMMTIIASDQLGEFGCKTSNTTLTVTVLPQNMHSPIFTQNNYSVTIDEFITLGSFININLYAPDSDLNVPQYNYGTVTYELLDTTGSFVVNAITGAVSTAKLLDWNKQKSYLFTAIATDTAGRFDVTYIQVFVTYNLEHVKPIFTQALYVANILEKSAISTFVTKVHAVDEINHLDYDFTYFQIDANSDWFSINALSGDVTVNGDISLQNIANGSHYLTIRVAAIHAESNQIAVCTVGIVVQNLNNYAPIMSQMIYTQAILESSPTGFEVLRVFASTINEGIFASITYLLEDTNVPFILNGKSGLITLGSPMDCEQQQSYILHVKAIAAGTTTPSSVSQVHIFILDVNDNKPALNTIFVPNGTQITRREPNGDYLVTLTDFPETFCLQPSSSGTCIDARPIFSLDCFDDDVDQINSLLKYSLFTPSVYAEVNLNNGLVVLTSEVDREKISSFYIVVKVSDQGTPSLTTLINITIFVRDLNDNIPIPVVNTLSLYVSELVSDDILASVTFSDADATAAWSTLSYVISGDVENKFFIVMADTGKNSGSNITRFLQCSGLIYNVLFPLKNSYSITIFAKNDASSLVNGRSAVSITVNVLPFISVPNDISTLLFNWQQSSFMPLTRRDVITAKTVQIRSQQAIGCNNDDCFNMTFNSVSSDICSCLIYGPGKTDYRSNAQFLTLRNLVSGAAIGYQFKSYLNSVEVFTSQLSIQHIPSYVPENLTVIVDTNKFIAAWSRPMKTNGALIGYKVCFCDRSLLDEIVPCTSDKITTYNGISLAPLIGYFSDTNAIGPDALDVALKFNTKYEVVVECTTAISHDGTFSIARSAPMQFTTSAVPTTDSASTFGSNGGAIAGVTITIIFVVIVLILFVVRRQRRKQPKMEDYQSDNSYNQPDDIKMNQTISSATLNDISNKSIITESSVSEAFSDTRGLSKQPVNMSETDKDGYWDYHVQERAKLFLPPGASFTLDSEPEVMELQKGNIPANFGLSGSHHRVSANLSMLSKGEKIPAFKVPTKAQLQAEGQEHGKYTLQQNLICQVITPAFKSRGQLHIEFESVFTQSAVVKQHMNFSEAKKEVNFVKNRYAEIFPADDSLVMLSSTSQEGSSYINASYVDGWNQKKAYIITQGPLPATVPDFWRMVWEENSGIILNTTSLEEGGAAKCHKYWPDEHNAHFMCSGIEVQHASVHNFAHFTVRDIILSKVKTNQDRKISLVSFSNWPDHGVPRSSIGVLEAIKHIWSLKAQYANDGVTGPVISHSSAGLGRSGTIVAIDICLRRVMDVGSIDVHATVLRMREQRPDVVDSVDQYTYIYDCLVDYINSVQGTEVKDTVSSQVTRLTVSELASLHNLGLGVDEDATVTILMEELNQFI